MKVSILGYGTVGKGVYSMISKSADFVAGPVLERKGVNCDVFHVHSIEEIVNNKEVDVVVECMGGVDTAFEFVSKCLKAKKNVVTSNKALVAAKGTELKALAEQNGVSFLFSAACGGAIPVLHNISVASETDKIVSCKGIMNGTTNFILSGIEEGIFENYSQALKKAQELGYAEADPTADVSGMDTLRKVMLLSSVAFGKLPCEGLCREGIENIDFYKDNETVKLVGECGLNSDGSVYAFVQPYICTDKDPLKAVNSNFNQIMYTGENCGQISLYGQGAGRYPTASAILRDLTAILHGTKTMFPEKLERTKADNSKVERTYVLFEDGKKSKVKKSVEAMHSYVNEKRNGGSKIFFAVLGE